MDEELVCQAHEVHKDAVERASGFMPDPETVEQLADFFKIFGDGTRVKIMLGMSMSAVSHQLRMLRDAHLVTSRREGRSIYYSLCDDHVKTVLETALEHVGEEG